MTNKKITRALISVYDKSGLLELASALVKSGCEIVSSGGTSVALKEAGIAVVTVESVTGTAQILGGRVKTLHPAIHGGILADLDNLEHKNELVNNKIGSFDLVIVNLYPFTKTVEFGASEAEIIEEIDIGGVALLRAAAKNFKHVSVISRVDQYQTLISKLSNGFSLQERKELASSAFTLTRDYDTAISSWLDPTNISLNFGGAKQLRYGENPHQSATLYRKDLVSGIASAEQLHGKEMSFNNYLDADAAWRAANDHKGISVAIIKHTNPCGIAVDISCHAAHKKALACDPVSAFGGVVAKNLKVIIAGAGGAAHLPGMVAALTTLPVIGVPVALKQLNGLDSLLSIAQMPAGVPVATVGIGNAKNAGLLAARILALSDEKVANKLKIYKSKIRLEAIKKGKSLQDTTKKSVKRK
jgi:phosphoribosylaminoimidazolecarboxamide formyltransferase/IMP cyclohydrolase